MSRIQPQPTSLAEWYQAVQQAQTLAGYHFDPALENYLVVTLEHFTTDSTLSSRILALDFLEQTTHSSPANFRSLRCIGDHCLLLSGLFPERANKHNVSLGYFVDIGREAYHIIASCPGAQQHDPKLFAHLSHNFVGLMDILHHIRLYTP